MNGIFLTAKYKVITIIGLCTLILGVGLVGLFRYSYTPGKVYLTLGKWPLKSNIQISESKPSLVVFLHPKCSCSRATVAELEELMIDLRTKVQVKVVFIRPKTRDIAWIKDDLWDDVSKIEGVDLVTDVGGQEAELFGAMTSGQTYLFDQGRRLIFQGGLTPSRGHRGTSEGKIFIRDWLSHKKLTNLITNVFGCGL